MRTCLLFSLLVLAASCRSEYKAMSPVEKGGSCLDELNIKPMQTSWYKATVEVYGKRMTGLLLIKYLEGGAYRTVFTNEAGVSFFDFEFSPDGKFAVKRIIEQMDRKPIIHTLRNDFLLLLRIPFSTGTEKVSTMGDEKFHGVAVDGKTAYFITDMKCASLRRLELASKRKRLVDIRLQGDLSTPSSITINHHTFDMVMVLNKLEKE